MPVICAGWYWLAVSRLRRLLTSPKPLPDENATNALTSLINTATTLLGLELANPKYSATHSILRDRLCDLQLSFALALIKSSPKDGISLLQSALKGVGFNPLF